MKLNHIALPVTDLAGATDYFERGFGFERMPAPAESMAILRGADGFALILQQPSDEAVHAAYQRLADAGLPLPAPHAVSYGCFAFWCQAPGGILTEVSHRPGP